MAIFGREDETVEEHEEVIETSSRIVEEEEQEEEAREGAGPRRNAELPDDVQDMLAELGEAAPSVQVKRRNPRNRKWEFLDNVPADDFSLGFMRDLYGGGDYQVRAKDASGQYIGGATRTFSIAGQPKDPTDEEEQAGQLDTLTELMRGIRDDLRSRQAAGGTDPLELGVKLSTIIQESIKPFQERILELTTREQGAQVDPLDLIDRAMELADRFRGDSGDSGSVVKDLGRELLTVFRQNRAGAPAGGPRPTPGGPTVNASTDPSEPTWVPFLRQSMPQLLHLARLRRNPETYAEVLLDQVGAGGQTFIAHVMETDPAFLDKFYLRFPEAGEHRYWFDQLFADLQDMLLGTEEEPEGEPTPQGGGDAKRDE